jgi:hypothetical protein
MTTSATTTATKVSAAATATDNENVSETSLIHRQSARRSELKIRVRRATR